MVRSLIIGGLAFGAAYFAEKQLDNIKSDLKRYDALRAMSGEGSFVKEQLGRVLGSAKEFGQAHKGEALGFLADMQSDLIRYARLRGL